MAISIFVSFVLVWGVSSQTSSTSMVAPSLQKSGVTLTSPLNADVSAVQNMYHVLVANVNLRFTMKKLQKVANLGGTSEGVRMLVSSMGSSFKSMLHQDQEMASLMGEVSAMGASWSSIGLSLQLRPLSPNEIRDTLGLHKILSSMKQAAVKLDFDVNKIAEEFEKQITTFSNAGGARAEQDELRKATEEIRKYKDELAAEEHQWLSIEEERIEVSSLLNQTIRMLNFMVQKEKGAGIQSAMMKTLKEAWGALQQRNVANAGFAMLGDIVTLGLGQFTNQRRKKEQLLREAYEDFKNDFDQTYGDVGTTTFTKKKADLEAEYTRHGERIKLLDTKKASSKMKQEELEQELSEKKKAFKAAKRSLMDKLKSMDAVNLEHFEQIIEASMTFQYQRSKQGAFRMFASSMIKQIEAYHTFVNSIADVDWETQKKTVAGILNARGGWMVAAPALGYAQQMTSSLGSLLTSDPDKKEDIPKIGELTSPATQMIKEYESRGMLDGPAAPGSSVSIEVMPDASVTQQPLQGTSTDDDGDIPI